ncbi:MAG TPA: hypothetical protein VLC48_05950 [Gemmatimonadota bacterium]|nr:hypothetical protein [Gemmatimonadota bacterium]
MNELKLRALTCPQCGAPGVVREGTRIIPCERCGVRLCLSESSTPRYEAVANVSAAQAVHLTRSWLDQRKQAGIFGRPELVLIPFHEVTGRRVGVFERKVPVSKRVIRRKRDPSSGEVYPVTEWAHEEREDTKVMVSDVQQLAPAARSPWDLTMFDARNARKMAQLRTFELVEAQRRATVYAAEQTASAAAQERFARKEETDLVANSQRTIFFPFWSIPILTGEGTYELVLEAVTGTIVSWRLPESYPAGSINWALFAVPGTLLLGHGLYGTFFGAPLIAPFLASVLGVMAIASALYQANKPDWRVRHWPEAGAIARLERDGS